MGDLISMFEKSKERQRRKGCGEEDSCIEKRKRKIRMLLFCYIELTTRAASAQFPSACLRVFLKALIIQHSSQKHLKEYLYDYVKIIIKIYEKRK